jgi:hypothetical protein
MEQNLASIRTINKARFQFVGVFDELEGAMARYVRDVVRRVGCYPLSPDGSDDAAIDTQGGSVNT